MGKEYTSSLYYFAEGQKSLTFHLSKKSVYDDFWRGDVIAHGIELEKRWIQLLHDIWAGFCYAQSLPGVKSMVSFNAAFKI